MGKAQDIIDELDPDIVLCGRCKRVRYDKTDNTRRCNKTLCPSCWEWTHEEHLRRLESASQSLNNFLRESRDGNEK